MFEWLFFINRIDWCFKLTRIYKCGDNITQWTTRYNLENFQTELEAWAVFSVVKISKEIDRKYSICVMDVCCIQGAPLWINFYFYF